MYIVYKQYQDKKAGRSQKRTSRFEKYGWYRYLRTIYVERGVVKFWSAIWYVPLLFASVSFSAGVYLSILSFIFPPLPLTKMHHMTGVIESISKHKKTADSLVFKQKNGKQLNFSIRAYNDEQKKLVGIPVTIYYAFNRTSSITFGNIVYEVMENNKSIRTLPYSLDSQIQSVKSLRALAKNSFIVMVLSIFMIWIQNRKEKPYHRLYRLKRYKKLNNIKKEK